MGTVRVTVSTAYAFDMLSIYGIKARKTGDYASFQLMCDEIETQLGAETCVTILESEEFRTLASANQKVFDLIDLIKQRVPTGDDATAIDQGNLERFKAKQALQAKFFPDLPLTEVKLGYNKGAA